MRLVFGVAINDADYILGKTVEGVRVLCPYYLVWRSMLARCYGKSDESRPTYINCSVCEEWLTFSKFRAWMETQDWQGKELDKDLLQVGNKQYSPETCVFVTNKLNSFLTDSGAIRGKYLIGVSWHSPTELYKARCGNNKGGSKYLGLFKTEIEAHLAWKHYKHELACKLADEQSDRRIAEALRKRYL